MIEPFDTFDRKVLRTTHKYVHGGYEATPYQHQDYPKVTGYDSKGNPIIAYAPTFQEMFPQAAKPQLAPTPQPEVMPIAPFLELKAQWQQELALQQNLREQLKQEIAAQAGLRAELYAHLDRLSQPAPEPVVFPKPEPSPLPVAAPTIEPWTIRLLNWLKRYFWHE